MYVVRAEDFKGQPSSQNLTRILEDSTITSRRANFTGKISSACKKQTFQYGVAVIASRQAFDVVSLGIVLVEQGSY